MFATALLNAQPMGFYAPAQIVRDAIEHGVEVLPIDINQSDWDNTLEPGPVAASRLHARHRDMDGDIKSAHAMRIGFRQAKGLKQEELERIRPLSAALYDFAQVSLQIFRDVVLSNQAYVELILNGPYTLDIQFMGLVDANNAYRYYEAIEIARKMEKYDVYWFEEPVAPDDYRGHAMIAAATSIPVATGENEYTRYGFRDLIEQKSAAILNRDGCPYRGPRIPERASGQ